MEDMLNASKEHILGSLNQSQSVVQRQLMSRNQYSSLSHMDLPLSDDMLYQDQGGNLSRILAQKREARCS